ncbi:ankyrin repeat protein [Acanthamoeba polyphaga moumouvirus]|uniref:Ankyrin repeat protein n=1 Tax=Acanthamoeba polyphaga moumouvirus TaxID=1269028 RepID=L7RFL0_9VIRU|nr:ankyrin repeat protein [Acanthamoeba polyphaga moumouvirus]AGC01580.1 ankyrin repeat protein [Acanthamoeba polyphaga moumouvirus]AQN67905.1 ankyrin repeat protein [Saudi moumouvirus]
MSSKLYFKITNENENEPGYFDFQYKDGLNILEGKFNDNVNNLYGPGRFYFSGPENICGDIDGGIYLREIYLPTHNPDFKMIKIGKKYGSNMIILGKRYFLGDPKTWKYMINSEINIRINNDYVIKYLAHKGYLDVIKYLHKCGLNIHTDNDYALISASIMGHLKVVKYLVKNGANVNCDNDSPLECSCRNGHFDVVKYLVKNGANIHACNESALKWAVSMNHYEIVKYLIKNGANVFVDNNHILKLSLYKDNLMMVTYLIGLGLSLDV